MQTPPHHLVPHSRPGAGFRPGLGFGFRFSAAPGFRVSPILPLGFVRVSGFGLVGIPASPARSVFGNTISISAPLFVCGLRCQSSLPTCNTSPVCIVGPSLTSRLHCRTVCIVGPSALTLSISDPRLHCRTISYRSRRRRADTRACAAAACPSPPPIRFRRDAPAARRPAARPGQAPR